MSINTTTPITAQRLTHESEIAKIDTRFYWFQGAWGNHQAIVVDTQTGLEYERVNRVPNTGTPITEAEVVALAEWVAAGRPTTGARAGFHSRQCFHRGLGYNPITLG